MCPHMEGEHIVLVKGTGHGSVAGVYPPLGSRKLADPVRDLLMAAEDFDAFWAMGWSFRRVLLDGPFPTPWRLERGPLLDLGPHVVDLLDAALGPVAAVHAGGDLGDFVTLQREHHSGVVCQVTLSGTTGIRAPRAGVALYGPPAFSRWTRRRPSALRRSPQWAGSSPR